MQKWKRAILSTSYYCSQKHSSYQIARLLLEQSLYEGQVSRDISQHCSFFRQLSLFVLTLNDHTESEHPHRRLQLLLGLISTLNISRGATHMVTRGLCLPGTSSEDSGRGNRNQMILLQAEVGSPGRAHVARLVRLEEDAGEGA